VGLTLLCALLVMQFLRARPVDLRDPTRSLGVAVSQTLRNQGVPSRAIHPEPPRLRSRDGARYYFTRVDVEVPAEMSGDGIEQVIERSLRREGVVVAEAASQAGSRTLHLAIGPAGVGEIRLYGVAPAGEAASLPVLSPAAAPSLPPAARRAPLPDPVDSPAAELKEWTPPMSDSESLVAQRPSRVAIIVDDGGYGGEAAEMILGLDHALTISVLPYTPRGMELAERASRLGFEVMLHMPMENLSDTLRHEGQLNVGMGDGEILRLTRSALAQVPHAAGINNHTGSKYTADAAAMRSFLNVVRDTGMYFVDSGTTADSIAYQTAREMGIPSAARTVFLDNEDDPALIRARFDELVRSAQTQGEAIGICHFRPHTARVLAETVPQLSSMGVQLVPASELTR
jgi:hypothetical protein